MLSRFRRVSAGLILSISALAEAAPGPTTSPEDNAPSLQAEAAPSSPKKKRKKKKKSPVGSVVHRAQRRKAHGDEPKPVSGLGFKSSVSLGFQHGYGVRRLDSPFLGLRAVWSRWRSIGPVRFELPLEYEQLNLPGADLNEFRGGATLRGTLQLSRRFEPFASAELTGVWRPNWPDLYQPAAGGGLLSTDRFSYFQRAYQLGVQALFGRSTRARVAYTYSLWDYRTDPAFHPVDSPNHLPPSDHDEHGLKLSIGTTLGPARPRLALDLFQRDYFFVFARDRQTGKTHAGPGGPPPNPLYVVRGAEPEISLAARLASVTLRGSFGVQLVDDAFQGYYSSVAQHPALSARWLAGKTWSVELAGELWFRRYGPDSYGQGPSHPALTFGDRRVDRTSSLQLVSRWKVNDEWALASSVKAVLRRSNFPAYEPGVFPRSARYSIDWSYDNWQLLLAAEYRNRQAEPQDATGN